MKPAVIPSSLAVALLLLLAILGPSCSSTQRMAAEPPFAVYRGMETADLVAGIGTPDEVLEVERDGAEAEIWVYRSVDEKVTMKTVSSEHYELSSVPGALVGGYSISQYEPEFTEYVSETLFLVVEDQIVAWKRQEAIE